VPHLDAGLKTEPESIIVSAIPPVTATEDDATSADIVAANLKGLKDLFPEAFGEWNVDFNILRQLLGDAIEDEDEKYGLNWSGKRKARRLALTPSTGTLLPAPTESVDWADTRNLVIEGDNLEVLKLLQKSYAGRIKTIYLDPPYNTGNDLLYPNDYSDGIQNYLEITGQIVGGARLTSNPETGGRYHANWLNLMYPRLMLAKNLLRPDGVLICTIDDNEVTNLGSVIKEIFHEGAYEHVCITIVHNPRGIQGTNFSYTHEYAFFVFPRGGKYIGDRRIDANEVSWSQFRNWGSESERHDARNCFYPVILKNGAIHGFGDVSPDGEHPSQTERHGDLTFVYPIDAGGIERKWRYARQSVDAIKHLLRARPSKLGFEIEIGKDFGMYRSVWTDKRYDANEYGTRIVNSLVPGSPFTFPKSLWAVYDCLYAAVSEDKEAIVLDFFAGSGTTGHAVWEINRSDGGRRRFILVQLPEKIEDHNKYGTIADITKQRLRAASSELKDDLVAVADLGFRVYKLASSNLKAWAPGEDLEVDLLSAADNLVPGRTEDDLLVELLLKQGIDLTEPAVTRIIAGRTVHAFGGGVLVVCLGAVAAPDAEALAGGIAQWVLELKPVAATTAFFKDTGFQNDQAKTNVDAILRQRLGEQLLKVRSV
jgi:adenine-specific DNA-methyltransferase